MRYPALVAATALTLAGCTQDDGDPPVDEQTQGQDGAQTEDPFEPPQTGVPPDDEPPVDISQPEWSAPPENQIGAPVTIDPVLFEGPNVVVALTQMTAYTTGAELRFAVRIPPEAQGSGAAPQEDPMGTVGQSAPSPGPDGTLPDDLLRIGVVYPDGSTTSTVEQPAAPGDQPEPPVLSRSTSMGATYSWDYEMWLWPLPQPGEQPFQVAVQWPEHGIDATEDVDVDEIGAAEQRVVQLWPEDGEP